MKPLIKISLIIILVLPTFIFTSCIKDELTLPTEVNFKFGIEPHEQEEDGLKSNYPSTNSVIINNGTLTIDAIEFDGKRNEGKDVFFISNFSEIIIANLESQTTNRSVRFDVPQGIYNQVDITLHLTDRHSSLILEGNVSVASQGQRKVRFEYNYSDIVRVRATSNNDQSIVLKKDTRTTVNVIVDAGFLFRFINPNAIANGDIVNNNGQDLILINEINNINLYNQLASRIDNSFKIVFE